MELVTKKNLILVAGRGHPELSTEVAQHLHVPLGEVSLSTFANGEIYCRYGENIRGADVFVFQSHADQINDRLMEQLIMIDAAKRASAKRITAVAPFYGYSRQDRKAEGATAGSMLANTSVRRTLGCFTDVILSNTARRAQRLFFDRALTAPGTADLY